MNKKKLKRAERERIRDRRAAVDGLTWEDVVNGTSTDKKQVKRKKSKPPRAKNPNRRDPNWAAKTSYTFGKHAGKKLWQVAAEGDLEYIRWVADTFPDGPAQAASQAYLSSRPTV